MKIYSESDFVKVVDGAGNEQPPVPKTWLSSRQGKNLLPAGVQKASTSRSSSSGSGSGSGDGPPAKSASKADWVAYATDEARGESRLTEEQAEQLNRDQLAERYSS